MSNTKHVTDNLSEFLDGTLNAGAFALVEAHLAACPECRAELAELRYIVTLTRALPTLRAPRSFTLSPEMAAKARPNWRFGWLYTSLRGFTAIAAVLLVMVCSADFLTVNRSGGFGASAPVPAVMSLPESSQTGSAVTDQATNQSKASATVIGPAAPAGAAAVSSALPPPGLTPFPLQSAQTPLSTATQAPRPAVSITGTPQGTARSAADAATATAVITPTKTPLPTPSPSLALTVTVTLYPTLPATTISAKGEELSAISPLRAAELGLFGALLLCVVATLFVRSARR